MNYQAYFATANNLGITFEQAFDMLSSFLNVMSTLERNCLHDECEQYKWSLPVTNEETYCVINDKFGRKTIVNFATNQEIVLFTGTHDECLKFMGLPYEIYQAI